MDHGEGEKACWVCFARREKHSCPSCCDIAANYLFNTNIRDKKHFVSFSFFTRKSALSLFANTTFFFARLEWLTSAFRVDLFSQELSFGISVFILSEPKIDDSEILRASSRSSLFQLLDFYFLFICLQACKSNFTAAVYFSHCSWCLAAALCSGDWEIWRRDEVITFRKFSQSGITLLA